MIKQGYEDFKRHRADREINDRKVEVLREGKMKTMKSEQITVGDIVRVSRDQQFPADLVLISASNNLGKCFVMTANLDGETNLKPLFASKAEFTTAEIRDRDSHCFKTLHLIIGSWHCIFDVQVYAKTSC